MPAEAKVTDADRPMAPSDYLIGMSTSLIVQPEGRGEERDSGRTGQLLFLAGYTW